MELPGIYIAVRSDYTQVAKDIKEAKEIVKQQAGEIANALDNALDPTKVAKNINDLVGHFSKLNQASTLADQAFKPLSVDLGELGRITGLTDAKLAELQSRMLKTQAAKEQENALRKLATSMDLTESEIRQLGAQFGVSAAQIEKVVNPANRADAAIKKIGSGGSGSGSMFGGMISGLSSAIGYFYMFERAVSGLKRAFEMVTELNATIETSTLGIASAFLTNGQYVDAITGKVLAGQDAMHAAMGDAKEVIDQLKVSNLQTSATLDDLIRAYQETAPVALAKSFDKTQIEKFTVAMIQAAGAIDSSGALMHQLGQETRALLTGDISSRDARIATALGITSQDIAKYKGDADGLFNYLMSKLSAYQAAGEELQKTWSGVTSNAADLFSIAAADISQPLFEAVRDGLKGLTDEMSGGGKGYSDFVASAREEVETFTKDLIAAKEVIVELWDLLNNAPTKVFSSLGSTSGMLGNFAGKVAKVIPGLSPFAMSGEAMGAVWGGVSALSDKVQAARGIGKFDGMDEAQATAAWLKQTLAELKTELDSSENAIFHFGDRDPDQIKAEIDTVRKALEDLNKQNGAKAAYQPTSKGDAEEIEKGRKALLQYIQTDKEAIEAKYANAVKYAQSETEIAKATGVRDKALAALAAREEKATEAAEKYKEKLKQIRAEISLYTSDAKGAADAAGDWTKDTNSAVDAITKLNDSISGEGLGNYGRMAFELAKMVADGTKDIAAYETQIADAETAVKATADAYETAIQRIEIAKEKLAANPAGSDEEDAKSVRALEDAAAGLNEKLGKQIIAYNELQTAKGLAVQTAPELIDAAQNQARIAAVKDAYSSIGAISQDTYDFLISEAQKEHDTFIQLTGDKATADRIFNEQRKRYAADLAADEYRTQGKVGGLVSTGLVKFDDGLKEDAIDFYSNLLPNAVEDSTSALSGFFRDIAQGNATLSESWEALGDSIENVVYDILQDLTQMYLKMAIMSSAKAVFGVSFGGGSGTAIGFHAGGVVGTDAATFTRSVPSSTFAGAPRYHTGLMSDEFPAILQKGESVLTKAQMSSLGAGISSKPAPNVNTIIHEAPGVKAETETRINDDGSVDTIVRILESKIAGRMAAGQGLHKVMGSMYGSRRRF